MTEIITIKSFFLILKDIIYLFAYQLHVFFLKHTDGIDVMKLHKYITE